MVQIQLRCSVHGKVPFDGVHILSHLEGHNFGDYLIQTSELAEPLITVVVPSVKREGSNYKMVAAFKTVDFSGLESVVAKAKTDGQDAEAFIARETKPAKLERGLV